MSCYCSFHTFCRTHFSVGSNIRGMVSLRLIGTVVALPAIIAICVVTGNRYWKVSGTVLALNFYLNCKVSNRGYDPTLLIDFHAGLWVYCTQSANAPGGSPCQRFGKDIAITQLPGGLLMQRALMVIASILGSVTVFLAFCSTNGLNISKFYFIK